MDGDGGRIPPKSHVPPPPPTVRFFSQRKGLNESTISNIYKY